MREIKFRAWKKTNTPEMFKNVTSVDFKKNVVGLDYKVSSWTLREDTESLDNVILMQYTGLKDKNGVEIYEGDILTSNVQPFKMVNPIKDGHGVVRFENGMFKLGAISLVTFINKMEVIGNIYENPELLNG